MVIIYQFHNCTSKGTLTQHVVYCTRQDGDGQLIAVFSVWKVNCARLDHLPLASLLLFCASADSDGRTVRRRLVYSALQYVGCNSTLKLTSSSNGYGLTDSKILPSAGKRLLKKGCKARIYILKSIFVTFSLQSRIFNI